jgi:hypothetical protein
MLEIIMKKCTWCWQIKGLEEFHSDIYQKDWKASKCKECKKIIPAKKNCKHCVTEFQPLRKSTKFCSIICRDKFWNYERWLKELKCQCVKCWTIFKQERKNNKYCSKECKNAFDADTRNRNTDYLKGLRKIKGQMIESKGFIYCQNCHTSNSLKWEYHHIVYRSEKPKHKHLHNEANIILCCIKCHNWFHKKKSNRNELIKERSLELIFWPLTQ